MEKPRRIIYPPVWLVIGLVTIFALNEYLPLARFTGTLGWALGGAAIVLGLILLVHAGGMFKVAETDLIPFQNVTALVTTGVYRVTRNPMYLGMTLVLQRLLQPKQRPGVVGVPNQVRPVHRFGLRVLPLFQKECAQGMAGGLHPAPGLVVG